MGIIIGIDVGISTTKIVGLRDGKVTAPIRITAADPVTSLYGAFGKYLHDNDIRLNEVAKKKIVAKGNNVTASTEELALAGKGFSEEAENAYKASNANLDFDAVDAIEAIVVSEADMKDFISEGHLAGGEE